MTVIAHGDGYLHKQPYNPSGWHPSRPFLDIPTTTMSNRDNNHTINKSFSPTTKSPTTPKSVQISTTTDRGVEGEEDDSDEQTVINEIAIANSFAFNKPIYVYTGYPYFQPYFSPFIQKK